MSWRGQPYLIDRHTNRVYQEAQAGGWPRLVGVYRNGEVVIQVGSRRRCHRTFEARGMSNDAHARRNYEKQLLSNRLEDVTCAYSSPLCRTAPWPKPCLRRWTRT